MSYLSGLGLRAPNYDLTPSVKVPGYEEACWRGWETICDQICKTTAKRDTERTVIAVECYSGLHDQELVDELLSGIQPVEFIDTLKSAFKPSEAIEELCKPCLGGNDPIFGYLTRLTIDDFLDPEKQDSLRSKVDALAKGTVLIYGPGASRCCDPDLLIYADLPRWEAQMRQRRNEVGNLGVNNQEEKASLQYKRSFFIDWRVCDKLKRELFDRIDFLLDTTTANDPKMITGDALIAGLNRAASRPFRVVPFFDPGPWGGQWMREVCQLPEGPPNYAWCFDCVPEENSLMLQFGENLVEIPSINLVFYHPDKLLGEPVHGLFGAEFPIRFDFLDTIEGGNLSFQVHPTVDFAREHFGLSYTQDESYYILDARGPASVYLGVKDDTEPEEMLNSLEIASKNPDQPFEAEKYVGKFSAKKHDHFLIPAGTCHCSGAGCMVLEISHTPYIFTFKLWDWARLGLDGKPRPINLERGKQVIRWNRTESWAEQHLVNQFEPIAEGDGWREERTGLYQSEFIETRRHWFTRAVEHDTQGKSVHVINLVEGAEALIESPEGAFEPYIVHYAETFIVPAEVGRYRIRPHSEAEGTQCATLKAYVRVNG